jgi:hypothetical protein
MKKNEEPDEDKDINTAVMVFAHYIGIDLDSEPDLIWIAEEAFDKLPEGWEFGIGDGEHAGIPFFYNSVTGESDWKHPDEEYYMRKVKKERKENVTKKKNVHDQQDIDNHSKLKIDTSANAMNDRGKPSISTTKKDSQKTKEFTDIEVIEDFEDFDEPKKPPMKKQEDDIKQQSSAGRKKDRPSFGMSEEDFLDDHVANSSSAQTGSNFKFKDDKGPLSVGFHGEQIEKRGAPAKEERMHSNVTNSNQRNRSESPPATSSWGIAATHQERGDLNRENDRNPSRERERLLQNTRENEREREREREKDINKNRERERSSSRSGRERDYQEKDIDRDSSPNRGHNLGRDRDREKERERGDKEKDREIGFLETETKRLERLLNEYKHDKESLLSEKDEMRQKHNQEVSQFKEQIRDFENRVFEERREVKLMNDKLVQQSSESQSKIKEKEENGEFKLKELQRKIKQEADEEYHEKLKTVERRHLEETDSLKADVLTQKRKFDDLSRDYEFLKRKSFHSKEESKLETQKELDEFKAKYFELEETHLLRINENKRAQEEIVLLKNKVNSLTQEIQKIIMDNEHLKISQKTVTEESAVKSSVYLQTLERISRLEVESSQLKAENQFLLKEKYNLELENKKLSARQLVSNDQVSVNENELRRQKAISQNEINHLHSRVVELEATNSILKEQIEKQLLHDSTELKSFQILNHSLESENQRMKEKLFELTMKEEELSLRIRNQEKDLLNFQELVYKKEKQIKEEKHQQENLESIVTKIRKENDDERRSLLSRVKDLQQENEKIAKKCENEIQDIQQDVLRQLPKMIQSALAKQQLSLQETFQEKQKETKKDYERLVEKKELEMNELKQFFAEKETKMKLFLKDDKLQIDYLQNKNKELIQERDSLEVLLMENKKQMKFLEYQHFGPSPPPPVPLRAHSSNSSSSPATTGVSRYQTQPAQQEYSSLESEHRPIEKIVPPNPGSSSSFSPSPPPITADMMDFLSKQLAVMKEQITESLRSSTPVTRPGGNNKENEINEQHHLLVSSLEAPRFIASVGEKNHPANNRLDDPISSSSSSSLFLSPERKGLDVMILREKERKNRENNSSSSRVTFDDQSLEFQQNGLRNGAAKKTSSKSFHELDRIQASNYPNSKNTNVDHGQEEDEMDQGSFSMNQSQQTVQNRSLQDYQQLYSTNSFLNASSTSLSMNNSSHNRLRNDLLNSSIELLDELPDFNNLRTGGYYEGYWKAKYSNWR